VVQGRLVTLPVVQGRLVTLLVIKREWLKMILDGNKTWEIRSRACHIHVGKMLYLAESLQKSKKPGSASSWFKGRVMFVASHGPLTQEEWDSNQSRHCVKSASRYYGSHTYAHEFGSVEVASHPVSFERKKGAVIFQKKVRIEESVLDKAEFKLVGG